MKVLILTTIFPNNIEPHKGPFNRQVTEALSGLMQVKVVAPVPWFPGINALKKIFPEQSKYVNVKATGMLNNVEVFHPRYFIIPKFFRSLYGFFYFLSVLPLLLRIKKSFDFDILFCPWAYPDGFAGVLFGKLFRKPCIVEPLGCDINLFTKFFLRRVLIKNSLKNSNGIIVVSDALKQKLKSLGIEEEHIKVITNGVDQNLFKPIPMEDCRRKLDLPSDKKVIIFIGHFEEVKGVDILIEAFDKLSATADEYLLLMIGHGPWEEELKQEVNSKGLNKRVIIAGAKAHSEIPIWINAANILCLPSIREGCPNVLLEAIACKKPIVASNVGGIPEIVSSEVGLLSRVSDSDDLKNKLKDALEQEEQFKEKLGKVDVKTWIKVAEEIRGYFQTIVSENG